MSTIYDDIKEKRKRYLEGSEMTYVETFEKESTKLKLIYEKLLKANEEGTPLEKVAEDTDCQYLGTVKIVDIVKHG